MSTSPIGSSTPLLPTTSSTSGTNTSGYNLQPSDFINMMVTQLQNQDPLNPTSSADLLAQMSQIGQLQASDSLQTSLQSMTLQTSLGSAGNLIGKSVSGLDDNGNPLNGIVNSVQVQSGNVYLQLTSGQSLALSNVTQISNPPTTGATGTASTATGATGGSATASANPGSAASAAAAALASSAATQSIAAALGASAAAAPANSTASLLNSLAAAA